MAGRSLLLRMMMDDFGGSGSCHGGREGAQVCSGRGVEGRYRHKKLIKKKHLIKKEACFQLGLRPGLPQLQRRRTRALLNGVN